MLHRHPDSPFGETTVLKRFFRRSSMAKFWATRKNHVEKTVLGIEPIQSPIDPEENILGQVMAAVVVANDSVKKIDNPSLVAFHNDTVSLLISGERSLD